MSSSTSTTSTESIAQLRMQRRVYLTAAVTAALVIVIVGLTTHRFDVASMSTPIVAVMAAMAAQTSKKLKAALVKAE